MTILLFVTGFALSSISTIYAVVGLMSIFTGAPVTIMIMGTALEISKLVIASWLYRNWKEIPIFLRTYFSIAMIVLMFLTSMSIFGYLSKSHLDAGVESGESISALQIVDEKITTQRENITQAKTALTQMDNQVNEMLSRSKDENGTSKAVTIRKQQKAERSSLAKEITEAQAIITTLQTERAPLATSVRKVEAEVGPIKYIANLIYGDNVDSNMLEKAVRIVILMIVFVFDPLAVLLLIAANWNQLKFNKDEPLLKDNHIAINKETDSQSIQNEVIVNSEKQFESDELFIDEPNEKYVIEKIIEPEAAPEEITRPLLIMDAPIVELETIPPPGFPFDGLPFTNDPESLNIGISSRTHIIDKIHIHRE